MGMNSEISTYTISVFELQEYNFDFGLTEYPIWDEAYRPILNKAILDFYMFREIGYANPQVWRQRLMNRMSIIMRNKYNELYKNKAIPFNPLYTMELYEEYTHKISNDGATNSNGEINYNTDGTNTTTRDENNTTDNVNNETNTTANTNTQTTNTDTINNQTNNIATTDSTTNDSNNLGLTSQFPSEEMTENDLTSNLFIDNATKTTGKTTAIGTSGVDTTIVETIGVINALHGTSGADNTIHGTNKIDTVSHGTNKIVNTGIDKTVNTNVGTNNNNMDESYNKKTYGSASDLSFAHSMTQFKDYVDRFDLDNQVIAELKDLFMQVW